MEKERFIDGIWFSVQHLVLVQDRPAMAADLIHEAGLDKSQCLKAQHRSGHETEKMLLFLKKEMKFKGIRRKDRKSRNNSIIVISPPMFLEYNNKEQITIMNHQCSSCHGAGCDICKGTGKLDAVITIEWEAHK